MNLYRLWWDSSGKETLLWKIRYWILYPPTCFFYGLYHIVIPLYLMITREWWTLGVESRVDFENRLLRNMGLPEQKVRDGEKK